VLVGNVMKDSPAEKGGLKTGDIIQEFNNTKITNVRQLQREVAQGPINAPAKVKVLRRSNPWPDRHARRAAHGNGRRPSEAPPRRPRGSGSAWQDLTPELREQLKVTAGDGVVVSGVEDDGPAAKAGLRAGTSSRKSTRTRAQRGGFHALARSDAAGKQPLAARPARRQSRFVVVSPKQS